MTWTAFFATSEAWQRRALPLAERIAEKSPNVLNAKLSAIAPVQISPHIGGYFHSGCVMETYAEFMTLALEQREAIKNTDK